MPGGPPDPLEDLSSQLAPSNGKTQAPVAATPKTPPPVSKPPVPSQQGKKGQGRPPAKIQKILPRSGVAKKGALNVIGTKLSQDKDFEENLEDLLNRSLQITHHDREMAMALFQVHLDRGEELDNLDLTMPVAQVIGDNTGATLKALELAMKAGDRVVKIAELLARAKKEDLSNIINYLKVTLKLGEDDDSNWSDLDDLPPDDGSKDLKQLPAPVEVAGD